MRLLRAYNPLAYPGGRLPGFDPSHPAAAPKPISVISINADIVALDSVASGAVFAGTTGFTVDGGIGPAVVYNTTSSGLKISRSVARTPPASTLAAICRANVSMASGIFTLVGNDVSANGQQLIVQNGTLQWNDWNGLTVNSFIPVSIGVPYFIVASDTGAIVNCLVLNLANGQMTTAAITHSIHAVTTGGILVGALPALGGFFGGSIAAAMCSDAALSMASLRAWAADPWAFWYPKSSQSLMLSGLESIILDTLFDSQSMIMM